MKYEDKTKEQLISELKEMHQQITKLNALPDMYEKTEEDLQLLKNLVNQTNDALYVVDPERSYILDFNDTACKTLGYRRSELLKMKVPDVCLSIIDQPTWNKVVEETKEKGFFILEGEQRRKDNSTFTVELNARYVPYDKNDYLIVVARDITERKKAENEQLRLNEELNKRVEELEEFYKMAVGRELKMKELKEKIEHLESELMKHKSKLTEKSSLLKGSEGSRGLRFK